MLFCPSCLQELVFTDPTTRCRRCYKELEGRSCHCWKVLKLPFSFAAVLEASPAAWAFQHSYRTLSNRSLTRSAAALAALYLLEQPYKIDGIIPMPFSWPKRLVKGPSPAIEIAQTLSSILQLPYMPCLIHPWRPKLLSTSSPTLEDRSLLILSDNQDFALLTEATLSLRAGYPQSIHVLCVVEEDFNSSAHITARQAPIPAQCLRQVSGSTSICKAVTT